MSCEIKADDITATVIPSDIQIHLLLARKMKIYAKHVRLKKIKKEFNPTSIAFKALICS
jgi:hypothetical protein